MAGGAVRAIRGGVARRGRAVERVGRGARKWKWQFADSAGSHLHARSAAESPRPSDDGGGEFQRGTGAGTSGIFDRRSRDRRRALHSRHAAKQAPRVGFVMSGQGPQWWGMGREFMQHEPVFRSDDGSVRGGDAPLGGVLADGGTRAQPGELRNCTGRRSRSRRFLRCKSRWRNFGNRGAWRRLRWPGTAWARSRRHAWPEF